MILGIDEAGRGPWAGPLVVGAAILGGAEIAGLTDSKKLSRKRREELYPIIRERAVACATGWVSARELDEIGMSEALRLATRRAVEQIAASYSEIIIDGMVNFLAGTGKGAYVQTMTKADLLVPSVSAASILAKVERDWYMAGLEEKYPGYGFGAHAGYGTARHRAAIEELGVTAEHRLSFAPLAKYREVGRSGGSSDKFSETSAARDFAGVYPTESRSEAVSENFVAETTEVTTRAIGDRAESAVAVWLEQDGHEILERNWRTRWCEIDIVSRKDGTVYFTEVKYRKNAVHGDGFAAITARKVRQMTFAAEYFVAKFQIDAPIQLAAAAVSGVEFAVEAWVALE